MKQVGTYRRLYELQFSNSEAPKVVAETVRIGPMQIRSMTGFAQVKAKFGRTAEVRRPVPLTLKPGSVSPFR